MRRRPALRRKRHVINSYVPVWTDSSVLAFKHHLKKTNKQTNEKNKKI